MNYQKVILNFPSTEWANDNGPFQQANHGTYSNPGTQVVAQNKNLVTVSRWTQLEDSVVPSVVQTTNEKCIHLNLPIFSVERLTVTNCMMAFLLRVIVR